MARTSNTNAARMTKADFAAHAAQREADNKADDLSAARKAVAEKEVAELRAKREAERAAKADLAAKNEAAAKALLAAAAAQPKPAAATPEELGIGIELDFELPSWKRVLVGFVCGIAVAGAAGYGIGLIAAYCIAGIMTLTTNAALALISSFIVWLLAVYASWKIGGWIGGKVFASVVLPDGLASRAAASVSNAASDAKSTVAGWFGTSKDKVQAKFSGAHTKVAAA